MQIFSKSALRYRAKIERATGYSLETAPELTTISSDNPCMLVMETEGKGAGSLGRIITGRYSVYFLAATDLQVNDILTITLRGVAAGEYKVETLGSFDTHVEAVLDRTK